MRLLRSEFLKLRTTPRTVIGLLLPLLAIVIIAVAGNATDDSSPTAKLDNMLEVLGIVDIFALIFGVLVITWEYRHSTITETFLVEPRRERVIAAKTGVSLLTGAVLVLAASAIALGIAYVWIGGDPGISFDSSVWERVARQVPSSAIYGALGVALGTVVRGQALAIVIALVWFLIFEPLVFGIYNELGRYLPGRVLAQVAESTNTDVHVGTGAAVGLSILYAVVFVAVAAFLTIKRDVT